jgi:hypothetical protein
MRQTADRGAPRLPPIEAKSPDVPAPAQDEAPAGADEPELHGTESGLPDPDMPGAAPPPEEPTPSPEPSADPSPPDQQERIPGLSAMWQAEDLSWRPLVLGNEEGWPPRLWPPDDDTESPAPELDDGSTGLPPPQDPSPDPEPELLALPPESELPPPPPEGAA